MPKKNEFALVAKGVDEELKTRRHGVERCRREGETVTRALDGISCWLDDIERRIEESPQESAILIADHPHAGRSHPATLPMTRYRVSFFKTLLSSDGHPFKCLQQAIEVRHARSAERAIHAAERCYERLHRVPSWKLHADIIELEVHGDKIDPGLVQGGAQHRQSIAY